MKKILLWVIVGIIVISVIGCNTPAKQTTNTQTQTTTTTPNPALKPPTSSATITKAEFEQIQNGITLQEVEKIIGGKGELSSSAGDGQYKIEIYIWRGEGGPGSIGNVTFQNGKVFAKAQVGLQ